MNSFYKYIYIYGNDNPLWLGNSNKIFYEAPLPKGSGFLKLK